MKFNYSTILALVLATAEKLKTVSEDKVVTVNEVLDIAKTVVDSLGIGDRPVVDLRKSKE